jgi:hydrogenase-4 component B
MTLTLVLLAAGLLVTGAVGALACGRHDRAAVLVGTVATALASLLGAGASLIFLLGPPAASAPVTCWTTPVGAVTLGVDPLSAFFLLCVFVVSGLAGVYGEGYLRAAIGQRRLAPVVAFFQILIATMCLVVLARDAVVFLAAWEGMSISSLFLVAFENDREDVRRASTAYLLASHAGVVLLFLLFGLLGQRAGSFAFQAFVDAGVPPHAGALFVLALVGFGTKAGFWPLHVWLPDAHPAAPSHVSAVMSGVMIKMGIYGLLRACTFIGPPEAWWGGVMIAIGAVSGLAGVLHALAQHDLKRLLAYCSVENIGVIAMGMGLGMLGQAQQHPLVAFAGYAGALLHVLNHGLFKGLLFQGAGSVLHATGTRSFDALGGLARRMPVTAATFLVGAVAISGLPPLNGFVSEWLVFVSAFRSATNVASGWAIASLAVAPVLALIGGLASACFVRAYGVVFLGEPRSERARAAHEGPATMRAPMVAGAALCAVIGLAGPWALRVVEAPARALAGGEVAVEDVAGPLAWVSRVALVLVAVVLALALLRATLLRGRDVRQTQTWGCGYASPTPRMQYTASSFAEPLLAPFAPAFHRHAHPQPPEGFFPAGSRDAVHLGDWADDVIRRLVHGAVHAFGKLRAIEHGRIPLYLAYVLLTLLGLLLWQATSAAGWW